MSEPANDDKTDWKNATRAPASNPLNGAEIIYAYTRAQAIDDGVLIDVSERASEAGFEWPVAITSGVFDTITPDEREKRCGQSFDGRLWDVLTMLWVAIRRAPPSLDRVDFRVLIRGAGRTRHLHAWAAATSEGHNGAPVITIMCQGED